MHALNPKTENLKPLKPFVDMQPVRILGLIVDIKAEVGIVVRVSIMVIGLRCVFQVTHYLNMNFYNLTTVALHDWRTYSDMR